MARARRNLGASLKTRESFARGARRTNAAFAFGPEGKAEGTERARVERGGDERCARGGGGGARGACAWAAGPSTRIFELECVKETLRELELA